MITDPTPPPLDPYAVLVGMLDAIVTLAQTLVDAGLVAPEQLAAAYRQAAVQQAAQPSLVDPRIRGTPIAVLANTFSARITPPAMPKPLLALVVDNEADGLLTPPPRAIS